MTTGAQILEEYNTYIDETGTGYLDTTAGNNVFKKANINIVDRKIEEFQATQKVTREMQPLILVTAPITLSVPQIDVSPTSLTVPNYYSFINLRVTSPYRGSSLVNYAEERRFDRFLDSFSEGDAFYPKYYFTDGLLNIEPLDSTSALLTYFRTPITIDVTDDTTPINYNDKLVQLLIDEAMRITGVKGRDQWITNQSQSSEVQNP